MARDPISEHGNFMKNSEYRFKRLAAKQAGLTLLEVIISLSIIASATLGLNAVADRFSDDTKNTVTASQVRTFGEAAKAYIKDNYAAVQGVATATAPALIDVPTLIASGHLTTGFFPTNAFGQSMCALVLEPTANRLQAMVVAEGGTVIDDLSMGNIASVIGGSGGAVYASDATVIRGAIGGWSIPVSTFDNLVNNVSKKCDGTAGNVRLVAGSPAMALWFENGDTSSAFLARDAVPGRPELNAMNTPLVMNAVQTVDVACTNLGAIARNASGAILSCNGGRWRTQGSLFWEDPVATYAALPACTASIAGQTRVVTSPTVGTGQRAHSCNGATWTALSVGDNGNLTLPGILTTGKVQVNDVVTEGSACGANGLVAKDATGLLLSCQSGAWAKQPIPEAFSDSFNLTISDFSNGNVDGCGPSRNYLVPLAKRAIVHVTLYAVTETTIPQTGILINGLVCGYNIDRNAGNNSISTSCSQIAPAGTLDLKLCVNGGSSFARGSVVVQYTE